MLFWLQDTDMKACCFDTLLYIVFCLATLVTQSQQSVPSLRVELCNCRKAFSKTEEVSAEFVLVSKIIHHLIRKDNALIVIDTPSRNEGESLELFNKRQQRERILAVNPNYAAE